MWLMPTAVLVVVIFYVSLILCIINAINSYK